MGSLLVGHGGHETVDHAVVELPLRLKSKLGSALAQSDSTSLSHSPDRVSSILADVIAAYDQSLLADFSALFPEGLDGISKLSEGEIDNIVNDADRGGENLRKVHRCMRGSTALISLVDPSGENLWVANLGDCQAGQ
jgi:pyruvate dehydrogenase phosphatase